jgi:hypothetical protein
MTYPFEHIPPNDKLHPVLIVSGTFPVFGHRTDQMNEESQSSASDRIPEASLRAGKPQTVLFPLARLMFPRGSHRQNQ